MKKNKNLLLIYPIIIIMLLVSYINLQHKKIKALENLIN